MKKALLTLMLGAGASVFTPAHSDQVLSSEFVLSSGEILSQSSTGRVFYFVVSKQSKIYFCTVKREFINCDRPAAAMSN